MNDDLDRQLGELLSESFTAHGRRAGRPHGRLEDVLRRVARRRARRRAIAGIGSFALVTAGIGGIVAVGRIDRDDTARGTGGPASTPATAHGSWFVCAGVNDEGRYEWCELETPYLNPVWECTGPMSDPAVDGDDRPRFEQCRAVGELFDDNGCDAIAAPTTTAGTEGTSPDPVGTVPVEHVCTVNLPGPTIPPGIPPQVCAPTDEPGVVTCPTNPASSMPLPTAPSVATTIVATTPPGGAPPPTSSLTCTRDCVKRSPVEQRHTVAAGDSLDSIARAYGITWEQLAAYNEFDEDDVLLPGDEVRIPPDALLAPDVCAHTIEVGDSPASVAARYATGVEALQDLNEANPAFVRFLVGDQIFVPRTTDC